MSEFIGRERELQKLIDLGQQKRASVVVVKGRRRVGKSRLIEEYGRDKVLLSFTALAPLEQVTAQDQRDNFANKLCAYFDLPPFTLNDWSDAFAHLTKYLTGQPTVILFDEISWMGAKDPTFIPKLKVWWDSTLQHYSNVMLIFCGSVSTWIEDNIINSTAFFGRISLEMTLEELSLPQSYQFLQKIGFKASIMDCFKILSVTGGVPWYLEQIDAHHTADENIKRLCFEKDGLLVIEFDKIFHDLFDGRGAIYKKIVHVLAEGMCDLNKLRKKLRYPESGSLSKYIEALVISGFVTKHYQWSLKTKLVKNKQTIYRLSDNYLKFYIKYIEVDLPKIQNNVYQDLALSNLPGWESMMGLQVENLLLKNRLSLIKALGIYPQDIVADNPYIQRSTVRKKGCQIDYLIQSYTNNLFVCEFKFKRRELGTEIIDSMKEKIHRLTVPRGFGICPVLVHLGGVSETVDTSRYFYRIIDIADFLDIS